MTIRRVKRVGPVVRDATGSVALPRDATVAGPRGAQGEPGPPGADSTVPGPQGPAGSGGGTVYSLTLDMGTTPLRARRFQGVAVAGLTAGQHLVASASLDMPGTLSPDELEMDPVTVAARATADDTADIIITSPGLITGQRRINLIGA